jgi:hypothetical protein
MTHEELAKLEKFVEVATPVKELFGERVVNRWVQSLEAKGYTATAARTMVELQSLRMQYIRFIRRSS